MIATDNARVFIDGRSVEVWTNPDAPFGCSDDHIQRYVEHGAWILLFNAVALTGVTEPAPYGS